MIAFVVFASTILLTQIVSSAEGKYSEARKNAKARNNMLVEKERIAAIKKLNPSATVNTISKSIKTKAQADAINASYLSALNTAKEKLKQAKEDLNLAKRAYVRDSSNSAKKSAVTAAELVVKNAENALQIVLLNKT
ncbi:MAG: hypothetical protein EPO63_03165 [Candidatus Nitrosotenuis sp.]|nr:MAG: hypothetical protein EPO63_03165 [Candidatus Nitrosotenuis sp.]